ncbi:hypothetical protein [Polyangium spumosum]|uniref:MYXO-CTERM sorting domain-containing protein n=1 Tax=Polyangium spumosum TaxID=889282 RepID=A0A6N7PRT1_9BACT|nr:hypothetical protein [Polyangium spumosum]MRG94758.1 hypothetical protein [Polyangium spumosum]
MRTSLAPIFAAFALAGATFGFASSADAARLDACNGIELSANANCEMRVSGGCTAACEPVSFQVQCAADLYIGCNGQCTAMVDAQCTAGCTGGCEAECEVNPGSFDCSASCRADCGANCDAACAADPNSARCKASCEATCGGECDARCDVTPPDANCKAQCEACCTGSCDAKANIDCQIDCQADAFVQCEADLKGGCEVACQRPEGALFCDGQYVDVGEQIDSCVAQLESLLQVKVEGYARGDAQCSGGRCTAEGEAGVSCAQSPGNTSSSAAGILGAIAAFGLALGRRKSQKK